MRDVLKIQPDYKKNGDTNPGPMSSLSQQIFFFNSLQLSGKFYFYDRLDTQYALYDWLIKLGKNKESSTNYEQGSDNLEQSILKKIK